MRYQRVTVTPEIAKEWLAHNITNNRSLNRNRVLQYATDMKNDQWMMSPNSVIAFDTNGNLIDGQHRLMAVIEADKPVNMVVCYDNDPDVMRVIDTGMARTNYQIAKLNGNQLMGNKEMAAVCRSYLRYIRRPTVQVCSYQMLEDFMHKHETELRTVFEVIGCGKCGSNKRKMPAAVATGVMMAYLNGVAVNTLKRFVDSYRNAIVDDEACKHPIKLAQTVMMLSGSSRLNFYDLEALTECSIQAFDKGLVSLSRTKERKYTKEDWD